MDAMYPERDPLYDAAAALVIAEQRASVSFVQRKLVLGYNRAARLVEALEAGGIVSGYGPDGNRSVLVKPEPQA